MHVCSPWPWPFPWAWPAEGRAEDLLACASRTGAFTDEAGKTLAMELFKPFFFALSAPGYKDRLASLL